MPAIAPIQTTTILQNLMRAEKLTNQETAGLIGISIMTLANFMKGRTNPHPETLEKIEGFLKDNGAMSRFGFPTDVPPPVEMPGDTEQLKDMGIITAKEHLHYCCAYLSDDEFITLVAALKDHKPLLGKLCTQDFPSLCE